MPALKPFQLLEINIISAQDLEPVSKKIRTYATAWVHSNRKLSTAVDKEGNNNPTWNDKFVFRVNEEFLRIDTSAVMIEIYSKNWFRDTLVGTVRVLVGNLIPPLNRSHHHVGMRFVALQIRRPSGRPQGILNIGVAVLDSSMRSMPLYRQLSTSAFGYRALMGEEDPHTKNNNHHQTKNHRQLPAVKPILFHSKSERSDRITFDNFSVTNSSIVAIPQKNGPNGKASSIVSTSDFGEFLKGTDKNGKASSVISGAELKPPPKEIRKKKKASSLISGSIFSRDSVKDEVKIENPITVVKRKSKVTDEKLGSEISDPPAKKTVDETKNNGSGILFPPKQIPAPVIGMPISKGSLPNGKFILGAPQRANSILSGSEVGPSPSEVAAVMVEKKYPLEDERSSVWDGWSIDESMEGLRSKLERWRTELPPLYDRGLSSSTFRSSSLHTRRHSKGESGMFSCFSNVYGYECQCICGKPPGQRGVSTRFHSPSMGNTGRSF